MLKPIQEFRLMLNRLRDTLFKGLFRARFRYDVFISYNHRAKSYAVNLKKQLADLDFACFIDQEEAQQAEVGCVFDNGFQFTVIHTRGHSTAPRRRANQSSSPAMVNAFQLCIGDLSRFRIQIVRACPATMPWVIRTKC